MLNVVAMPSSPSLPSPGAISLFDAGLPLPEVLDATKGLGWALCAGWHPGHLPDHQMEHQIQHHLVEGVAAPLRFPAENSRPKKPPPKPPNSKSAFPAV